MYSIGNFSKICNVPVKTLRYYGDIGLLTPSYIDPVTNYRYYDYDKIQLIKKINLLKNCHIPLAVIKQLIEDDDCEQWTTILEQKIIELRFQKEKITKQIEEMQLLKLQMETDEDIIPGPLLSDCYIEERESLTVYSVREKIKVKFIDSLVKQLFERIYAFNLMMDGNLMAIFHERDSVCGEADVEMLMPVKAAANVGDCKVLPGGTFACLTVKGAYSELERGYKKLEGWIAEQNLAQSGSGFEIYESGLVPAEFNPRDIKPDLTRDPSEFMTRICIPIRKKTG